MPTIEFQMRRFSVVSSRLFEEILRGLVATIGHPDMHAFHNAVPRQGPLAISKRWFKGRSDLLIRRSSSAVTPAKFCVRNEAGKGPRLSVSSSVIRSS